MTDGHALIIGAGIAGPTIALAFERAGIDVGVFEAYDEPADYAGLFLNTASNGLDALRIIGVDVAESADGFPIPRMVMWSGAGKRLGEVGNGVPLADGTVSVCVRRGLLQKTLRDQALDRGILMQYGKRLDSFAVTDTGVVARFTDGSEASGDILIGADGIHSRTRQLLNPDAPRPRFTGMLSIGGYSSVPGLPPTTGTQHFVFGKRAFFGYLVREDGEIYWFRQRASRRGAESPGAGRGLGVAVDAAADRAVRRRHAPHRPDHRQHHCGDRRLPGARHPDQPGLAPRPGGVDRRCRACHVPVGRAGRLDGDRGRGQVGPMPVRHSGRRHSVRHLRVAAPCSGGEGGRLLQDHLEQQGRRPDRLGCSAT